jgi:hypothetical protein
MRKIEADWHEQPRGDFSWRGYATEEGNCGISLASSFFS